MDENTATAAPSGGAARAPSRTGEIGPGYRVGEYVVEELIGRGAFGSVYSGAHPVIGKRVAIKVLNPVHAVEPGIIARFLEEARAVNKIGNPNIVDIFSFGELEDGRHYFVMERLDGDPLSALLRQRGRLELPEVLAILAPVVQALEAAHAAGIAHRDLKPDNIFLGRGERGGYRAKLLDFGVAKLLDESSSPHATETGVTVGTPSYMAPEQCVGKGVDQRADIYAFGVLVYRMLTGVLPYQAESGSQMMAKHLYEEPRPPLEARADLSPRVGEVILWMLKKDKTERPQTIREAFAALEAAGREAARAPDSFADLDDEAGVTGEGSRSSRARSQGTRAAFAVVALVAVSLVGWLTIGASRDATKAEPPMPSAATVAAPGSSATLPAPSEIRPAAPSAAAAPGAPAPPLGSRPTLPLSARVRIELRGVPTGTTVHDERGALLGTAPGVLELPRSNSAMRLVIDAPDHERAREQIVPNRDRVLEVSLAPASRHPHPTTPSAAATTPERAEHPAQPERSPKPNDIEPWK